MRLTRRGFLGSMLAVITAGVGGFLGLAQAGSVRPTKKYMGLDADLMWYAPENDPLYVIAGEDVSCGDMVCMREGLVYKANSHRITQEKMAAKAFNNAFEAHDYWGFR